MSKPLPMRWGAKEPSASELAAAKLEAALQDLAAAQLAESAGAAEDAAIDAEIEAATEAGMKPSLMRTLRDRKEDASYNRKVLAAAVKKAVDAVQVAREKYNDMCAMESFEAEWPNALRLKEAWKTIAELQPGFAKRRGFRRTETGDMVVMPMPPLVGVLNLGGVGAEYGQPTGPIRKFIRGIEAIEAQRRREGKAA